MNKSDATPFINYHIINLAEFLYQELKKVQKCEKHYEHLPFSVSSYIRVHHRTYYLIFNEDLNRIENMIVYCIKEMKRGDYDKGYTQRGLLNEINTMFLDQFEKYLRIILEQRHVTSPL